MNETNALYQEAMDVLAETSRTFFIPISRLVPGLQEAVASAYLCMRAIDEIEDDPSLAVEIKVKLLNEISDILHQPVYEEALAALLTPYKSVLPEVTLRLADWVRFCPLSASDVVRESTSTMARDMAGWVERDWQVHTKEDLDSYTYCVAGAVGVLLSELWLWHDGTESDYTEAVAFGRGLQTVNILRNRKEDMERGVDYFPDQWGTEEMFAYTRGNLALADRYVANLKPGPVFDFCKLPLALAHGTLSALEAGEEKLNRAAVIEIVKQASAE
ncbi:phytoene/squalene synthase family protein [Paenibacillus sp. FSL H8-0034]|uniref:phytoene/squalene synthase family protein n=1 Tax=Paenibacillus sp. FSL H8-0034 TaxID=2954671 RepID=UPI0030F6E39F